jgi:UDP-N-acetylmuramate--alanine ligase
MKIEELEKTMKGAFCVHFVGIGGISMSSLAAITKKMGYRVSGSDRVASSLTERLSAEGITVFLSHRAEQVREADLVVYTAAVHDDNPELAEAKRLGLPLVSRADYLGWLMSRYVTRVGVAGTHGKSTVTSMLTDIFLAASLDPTVVSGAELKEMGGAYRLGGRQTFLFEACEYCDSFLSFCPTTAVITNIEYDHADYFKTMEQMLASFETYVSLAGRAVLNLDDAYTEQLAKGYGGELVTYAVKKPALYRAENVTFEEGCGSFTLTEKGRVLTTVSLAVPGYHNVMNALAAAATAASLGVLPAAIANGLAAFRGASRRFEYKGETKNGAAVYVDYAHHPSEIRATLAAAKAMGKRIVCVFQPHTYSRTAGLFDDFVECFSDADLTLFADIYAAREQNTFGISSELLCDRVPNGRYLGSFERLSAYLAENTTADDRIMILGAGDIVKLADLVLSK